MFVANQFFPRSIASMKQAFVKSGIMIIWDGGMYGLQRDMWILHFEYDRFKDDKILGMI